MSSVANAALVTSHAMTLDRPDAEHDLLLPRDVGRCGCQSAILPPSAIPASVTMPPQRAVFVDTTVSDLLAGTPDGGTIVGIGDGAVILAPTVGAEFLGNGAPLRLVRRAVFCRWSGGTAVVNGGVLTVDGAVSERMRFGPGRALEFVATFTQRLVPERRIRRGLWQPAVGHLQHGRNGQTSCLRARTLALHQTTTL